MLDIKFIRENADAVIDAANKKNKNIDLDALFILDDQRKKLGQEIDALRAKQKKASDQIAQADAETKETMIADVSLIKSEIQKLENALKPIENSLEETLYLIPNVISPETPVGVDESANKVIKTWGDKPEFDFDPLDHVALATELNMLDTEKASQISGSRFAYLKGDLVMLQFALIQMTFDSLTNSELIACLVEQEGLKISAKSFIPIIPPVMVRNDVQHAIHRVFGDQTYQFDDGLNLVASAEHTLAPYHMNEILDSEELPIRYIGYSTAFRKEAGTYGKDMGGIFRTHQFDKIELETFSTEEDGIQEQLLMVAIQEHLVQKLGLHYQLVHVCTGDMGGPDYNQYDIECWLPGQNKFRETHTSDYMTDYQTRGIQSRYRTKEGVKYLHTNDATAFAIGRTLIAILENYQNKDGSITIPEVLRPYMGGRDTIGRTQV